VHVLVMYEAELPGQMGDVCGIVCIHPLMWVFAKSAMTPGANQSQHDSLTVGSYRC